MVYTAVYQQQETGHGAHQTFCIFRTLSLFGDKLTGESHWTFTFIYH